jgi:fructose-1,6-bisphosphatase/inositol monophosphatase family enzyme
LKTFALVHVNLWYARKLDPASAFEPVRIGTHEKAALAIDLFAERLAAVELGRRLELFDPVIYGEESLRNQDLDLTGEERLTILLDTLDGSDLFRLGLGNWCSAAVLFVPASKRIVGAFVGVPEGFIYYWTPLDPRPFRYDLLTGRTAAVSGPSMTRNLADAAVAFYGQKIASLCSNAGPLTHENNAELRAKGLDLRVYNLAGIPAMVRTVDLAFGKRIDAVFELRGQYPHDVVAGAVIAQQAGATLVDLNGEPLDIAAALMRPADPTGKMRYILAATPELARDLLDHLRPRPAKSASPESQEAAA